MKRPKVSAQDVAEKAGVSRTTVSFVLNNTPGKIISEATRQRVLHAAEELQYTPNETARHLAMTKHHSVGLFICHTHSVFSDAYIIGLIEGMSKILNKHRFRLILQPLKLSQSDYLLLAGEDDVDGIILLNSHDGDEGLARVVSAGFPLVVIGTLTDKSIPQVDIRNREAAAEVTRHLIDLGHQRIGMIVHASTVYYAARDRYRGFQDALDEAGIENREEWVKFGDFTEESGYEAMQELLSASQQPTAVFAGNDMIAYGAVKAIKDAGLNIPGDISVAGFDDDFLSRYLNPPLTTMSLPAASLGAEAARLIVHAIRGNGIREKQVTLSPHLSIRESCRSLSG
jgi:DNA-binding LacI/PurR family transcriptional regulator